MTAPPRHRRRPARRVTHLSGDRHGRELRIHHPHHAATTTTIPPGPQPGQPSTGPYELYCPGTPVGNIALNNVTTPATIPTLSPGRVTVVRGLTNFQTQLNLPASITSAAAGAGQLGDHG